MYTALAVTWTQNCQCYKLYIYPLREIYTASIFSRHDSLSLKCHMCPLPWHALLNTVLFSSIIFPLTLVQTRPQNANADVGGKELVLVLNWVQVKHCIKKTCGAVDFRAPAVGLPPNGTPVWLCRKMHMPHSSCGWSKRKGPCTCIQFLLTQFARPFVTIRFSLYMPRRHTGRVRFCSTHSYLRHQTLWNDWWRETLVLLLGMTPNFQFLSSH
jgi:hypothetical protein